MYCATKFVVLLAVMLRDILPGECTALTGRKALLENLKATGDANSREGTEICEPSSPDRRRCRCNLCHDNWLFILGAGGRTGSTTALFMFRQIPGFEIAGEHFGVLEYQKNMLDVLPRLEDPNFDSHAFFHRQPVDRHRILCSVQAIAKALVLGKGFLEPTPKVIGFKEIRYTNHEMLRFIGMVFPCARYVFTYRKNEQVPVHAKSFQGNLMKGDLHSIWHQTRSVVEIFHERFNTTSRMLAVEDSSVENYNEALSGLLGVKGCKYDSILHENNDGGYTRGPPKSTLLGTCDTSAVNFTLTPAHIHHNEETWVKLFAPHHAHNL
jgi:hypothetical protein